MIYFPRHQLAADMADAVRGHTLFSDAPNGLFLAAPRRTGKTTFLRNDLLPTLETQGVEVVYVDLWSDQQRDPALLIQAAIQEAMAPHRPAIEKLAARWGISKVGLGQWIQLDATPTDNGVASLPEALRLLIEAGGRPVALVIDEAQQAVTTDAGNTLMAALKSARDQLNSPDHIQLMLVMSGSDRDKLLRLVNSHSAPFYGSQIQQMPLLGKAFIEHIADLIERQQPAQAPVDTDMLLQAFTAYGFRPQLFMEALGQAMSPLAADENRFEQRLVSLAQARQRDVEQDMASDYLGLDPVQQAVLWRMLEMREGFRPYNAESLAFYQRITGKSVSAQKAQRALESLRERTPPLAWKSSRGEYAVEDAAMTKWFRSLFDAGRWPPGADE
ncbi:AAA family ATPase [Halomonas sp. DN3]|uniref:AAA family ATPase n=1 Tax=Halomonas sp. DN3 TaxID=2953657 RepID=UPI00209F33F5|nr:ATP-binding protein [Halomonas sp. DN3]USZ50370.1 ATP-binding protein [Halomonas sp. DN3]